MLVTAKTNGTPIVLDSSWQIGAAISGNGRTTPIDMEPTIVLGKVSIDFDTAELPAGLYVMDIRFTNPQSRDQWSEMIKVVINRTVTHPSAR